MLLDLWQFCQPALLSLGGRLAGEGLLALLRRGREEAKAVDNKPTDGPGALLKAEELARRLRVSARQVRALTQAGKLPCVAITARTKRYCWATVAKALGLPPGEAG